MADKVIGYAESLRDAAIKVLITQLTPTTSKVTQES
jgi:hypothetical protein